MIDTGRQRTYWEEKQHGRRRHPTDPVIAAFVNPKLEYMRRYIQLPDAPRILDVGCGNGYFTHYFNRWGLTYGLDYASMMLKLNPAHNLMQGSALELPIASAAFDLVFCSNLLHHLPDPVRAVQEMRRVSKNYVVISEPNRNNPAMFALGLLKPEERASLKFILPLLRKFAAQAGLETIAGATMGFVTPNRMPRFLVNILKGLNAPNPFGAYAVLITHKTTET